MKSRQAVLACAATVLGLSVWGQTLEWNGRAGNGLWGTPANWTPEQKPVDGDTLVFRNVSELAVENDLPGLSPKSLQFVGSAAVTVRGGEIVFRTKNTIDAITNAVSLTIYAPLHVAASEAKWVLAEGTAIYGDVTIDTGCLLNLMGRPTNATPYPSNHFYGTVSGGGTLHNTARFAYMYLHKPVTLKCVSFGTGGPYYLADDCVVTTQDNIEIAYGAYFLQHAGVFASTTVWSWKKDYYRDANNSRNSRYYFSTMDAKQTIDRIESDPPLYNGVWKNSDFIESAANTTPVLTLLCTQDAVTYGCVCNGVGLTLDSATGHSQTFMDRAHTTTGPIVVKGGTFVSAGTNSFASVPKIMLAGGNFTVTSSTVGSLAGVEEILIFNGSTLTVGEDARLAFTEGKVSLAVAGTGKVAIPDSMDLTLADLHVNGIRPAAAVYSGVAGDGVVKADWIQGAGKIRLTGSLPARNEWTGNVSDDWNEPGNWTQGVPSSALEGYVYGGCPVMKDVEIAAFKGLVLSGAYGVKPELVIRGTHAFTDFTATVTDAKVTVAAGADVSFTSSDTTFNFFIDAGGEVRTEAGATVRMLHENVLRVRNGGVCDLQGDTLLNPSDNYSAGFDGTVRVGGNGKFGFDSTATKNKRLFFSSGSEAGTNHLVIADNATFGSAATGYNLNMLGIQNGSSGTAVMTIDTAASVNLGAGAYLGYGGPNNTGLVHGELRIKKGVVDVGYNGLFVGFFWKGYKALNGGRIVQSGGCLRLTGESYLTASGNGLVLGAGAGLNQEGAEQAKFLAGPGFYGIYEQSGGAFTNRYQNTMLGVGAATGTVVKTGGSFVQMSQPADRSGKTKEELAMILGLRGGLGVWQQSGGTTECMADVWIGGSPESAHTATFQYLDLATPPRSGRGKMVLSGGTFSVAGTLGVAYDGPGSLTLSGDARLAVKDLNLCKSPDRLDESKQYPAELAFVVTDASTPFVNVTGTMTVAAGAKLTVDARAYTGEQKIWLLKSAQTEGAFADADVTFRVSDDRYVLTRTSAGIRLGPSRGLVLIVR